MKTDEEIMFKISESLAKDCTGIVAQTLLLYLHPNIRRDYSNYAEGEPQLSQDRDRLIGLIKARTAKLGTSDEYNVFVSLSQISAWVFLLNDTNKFPDLTEYHDGGAEHIRTIQSHYGF